MYCSYVMESTTAFRPTHKAMTKTGGGGFWSEHTFYMPVASQLRLIHSWKHIFRSQISNEDVILKFLSRPVLIGFLVAWGVKLGLHDNELQNPTLSLPVCSRV